jgi:hypothetical protein
MLYWSQYWNFSFLATRNVQSIMMERMSRIAGNAGIIVSAQQYTNGNKNVV